MSPSLVEARDRLTRDWEELEVTVGDGTGLRLRRSWALLALAFCLGLHWAGRRRADRG
jgi:hypothetical protein